MSQHPWVHGILAVWRWYIVSACLGFLWLTLVPPLYFFVRWALGWGV